MQDKELVAKLNTLKEIRPESSWKKEARDVLLSQISNSVSSEVKVKFLDMALYNIKSVFAVVPKAAWSMICLVVIFTGGTVGTLAAKNSKPGDSLYVAKIAKEKVQLALIFNQEDKAKLDMKFASIHAREITEVLSRPDFVSGNNSKKAEQLTQNFKAEINTVKDRLSEINKIQDKKTDVPGSEVAISNATSNNASNSDDVKVGIGGINKSGDVKVYSTESGKDGKGIEIYDPSIRNASSSTAITVDKSSSSESLLVVKNGSSSTIAASSSTASANVSEKINLTLDKATLSFDTKDFSGAKDMLEQVGAIIEKIDSGTVKGAVESGASTSDSNAVSGAITSSTSNK